MCLEKSIFMLTIKTEKMWENVCILNSFGNVVVLIFCHKEIAVV